MFQEMSPNCKAETDYKIDLAKPFIQLNLFRFSNQFGPHWRVFFFFFLKLQKYKRKLHKSKGHPIKWEPIFDKFRRKPMSRALLEALGTKEKDRLNKGDKDRMPMTRASTSHGGSRSEVQRSITCLQSLSTISRCQPLALAKKHALLTAQVSLNSGE